MTDRPDVTPSFSVHDAPDATRFEARTDADELMGFAAYRRSGSHLVFTHTEVDDAWEGHGVGSRLARGALDKARAAGSSVDPRCPFIAAYIERHQEYADLVRR